MAVFQPQAAARGGQAGLSVMEILMGLAIFFVLGLLAFPSFTRLTLENRMASELNELVAGMQLARSEALKRGRSVSLCRTANPQAALPVCGTGNGWEAGWVVFADDSTPGVIDSADDLLLIRHVDTRGKLTLRGDTTLAQNIRFNGSGMALGSAGNLVACDHRGFGADSRAVIVTSGGLIRTTRAPGNGPTDCRSS